MLQHQGRISKYDLSSLAMKSILIKALIIDENHGAFED